MPTRKPIRNMSPAEIAAKKRASYTKGLHRRNEYKAKMRKQERANSSSPIKLPPRKPLHPLIQEAVEAMKRGKDWGSDE